MSTRKRIPVFLQIVFIVLLIAILVVGSYWVLRLGFDIDVLDRSGWKSTDAGMQYWDYHGKPLTGWQEINGDRFYFGEDGLMATGWQTVDGSRYYLGSSGIPCAGWQTIDGQRYCFDPDGSVHTGEFTVDQGRYFADSTGAVFTGWHQTADGTVYLGDDGLLRTGWQEIDGCRYYMHPQTGAISVGKTEVEGSLYYFDSQGMMCTGWQEIDGNRYYFHEDGTVALGWTDLGEHRYYFTEAQGMALGWQELDGNRYYFKEDGVMAIGQITLDGVNHFFTSQGVYVLLVNRWNAVPEGYEPQLVDYGQQQIDISAYDALCQMIADSEAEGLFCGVNNIYRSKETQQYIWNRKRRSLMAEGYNYATADAITGRSVAVPGHSEHQTGLAVDISTQDLEAQNWLAEHCWDYGFILRYPVGKKEITGIIYEPWHFRYVGLELAQELKELGLCLEEYIQMLTEQEDAKTPPEIS